jgi:membrane protein
VAVRFARDGCSLMAAATAFYGLICLIPLGALAISVFGRVLKHLAISDTEGHVFGLLRQALPPEAPAIEEAIRNFPNPTGPWFVEAVSLLGLLWAASRLFRTLEDVLTRVWSGHGRGRPLFVRNLVALAATGGAGLIFLMTMIVTATAAALAARSHLPAAGPLFHWLASWVTIVALPAGAWLMFLLMYVFLPQERVSWRTAAIGAGAAAALWEISRVVFASLVAQSAGYGKLYGSLAGTVLLGAWIYLSATIMLVGAELAVVLRDRHRAER